ncbi:MAG: hypothetical protein HYW22_02095 [Candidatus Aenigmarchaeota archaeon]|nr:hypothetical protein [Candidatus Aenigmarchaeota archaeon]
MVWDKILGWILTLVGLFFIVAMPGMGTGGPGKGYQPVEFGNSFVLIGIILTAIGIFLIVKT